MTVVHEDPADRAAKTQPDRAEVVVALCAVLLGLLIFAGSFLIGLGAGYDRIGPRFFPLIVAAGLVVSGGFLAWGAIRRPASATEVAEPKTSWSALRTLAVALAASVLLLERLGFIPTAALLFWLVARAFESRRPGRDAVVGLLLAVFVYVAFQNGLGLALPSGIFEGLLRSPW